MRILKITPLISLALSRPDPSPEGGSKPEASRFQLDWWNIAYEKNDPQFQELENFLTSVPENAGHCPPSNWVEDFWDLTMKDRQWKDKDLIRDVDEAYRHCKPLCMSILPEWWEMEPSFQEMINMPYVPHNPITAKRILEEVNGRNCPCIHCLRYPGEFLGLSDPNELQFHLTNPFIRLHEGNGYNWDGCICEPLAYPEGEPRGEPEGHPEGHPEPEHE